MPWLAPYQPAQRYCLIDLQRVAPDDLPYGNLLRAVARLEQSRSPDDVMRAVKALQRWLPKRGAEELRRAFADWLYQMAERMAPPGALVPAVRTLEEASMTLVERVAEWPKQWLREGREQGVAEGREQGVAEGREQGLTQGVYHQRALLCRQAAARFDADARLADLLAPIADPERLAAGALRDRRRVLRPLRSRLAIETPPVRVARPRPAGTGASRQESRQASA